MQIIQQRFIIYLVLVTAFPIGQNLPGLTGRAYAQDTATVDAHFELGLDPGITVTRPIGTLESIRGFTDFAGVYNPSGLVNFGVAAWVSFAFPQKNAGKQRLRVHSIRLDAGYEDITSMYETDALPGTIPGSGTSIINRATFQLDYFRTAYSVELMYGPQFMLRIGPSLAFQINASSMHNQITLTMENGNTNEAVVQQLADGNGDLKNPRIRAGIGATAAYRLPLGNFAFFQPFVGIDFPLSDVQFVWSPLIAHAGIGIGFTTTPKSTAPSPLPSISTQPAPVTTYFSADPVVQIASPLPLTFGGNQSPVYIPFIPHLFFEREKAALPVRYWQLNSRQEMENFDEARLPADALKVNRRTLDVIGSRLRQSPNAIVTITGTAATDELNVRTLARERAETVARYLRSVWEIEDDRIVIRAQQLPTTPSNAAYLEGRDENRRVDVEFSQPELYAPVAVAPTVQDNSVHFYIAAKRPTSPVERWEIEFFSGDSTLTTLKGNEIPDDQIVWLPNEGDRTHIARTGNLAYELRIFGGDSIPVIARGIVPVQVDITMHAGMLYQVSGFSYNSATIPPAVLASVHNIIRLIPVGSRVIIAGYADTLGTDKRNQALAVERANAIATLLDAPTEVVRFDEIETETNSILPSTSTPEGRFLNRGVLVFVALP